MVAQFIVSIGMHEHVERSVIERKPTHDVGKLYRRKRDLIAPSWMGSDLSLVKAAHLHPIAKLRGHHFAKFPCGIATGRIEINMCMPARDTRHIEIRHSPPFACECPLARRHLLLRPCPSGDAPTGRAFLEAWLACSSAKTMLVRLGTLEDAAVRQVCLTLRLMRLIAQPRVRNWNDRAQELRLLPRV